MLEQTQPQETKVCTYCHKELSIDQFTKKAGALGHKGRRNSRCKSCVNYICRTIYYPTYDRKTKRVIVEDITDPSKIYKQCVDCGKAQPLTYFHPTCKNPCRAWHWQSYCKTCVAARARNRVKEGYQRPEPDLAGKLLEHKLKNVKLRVFYGNGSNLLSFSLTVAFIRELIAKQSVNGNLFCAATKVVLNKEALDHPLSPSLDRIDNSRGYEPDNVRIVALLYNLARRRWDDQLVLSVIRNMAISTTITLVL